MSIESFYVSFSTDVPEPVYDQTNKIADFLTKLNPPIVLQGSGWKMALVSLHLTNSFDSLRQDQDYFFKLFRFVGDTKDPSKHIGTKITLPKNKRYNTILEIIQDMDNLVYTGKDSVNFHYNKLYDRIYILGLKVGESCYPSDGLREFLGYKENIIEPEPDNNFHQTYGIGIGLSKLQNSLKPIQYNVDRLSDQFDQMKLSNQLVLFGLKEDPYPEASESRFLGFCSTRFPGIPVTQNDIVSARRIGKQGSGLKPRPLVVVFCSSRMQQLILREKKCLQGSGVFISESLTKSRLQLLNYTKSKLGKRSTWSSGGEILTSLSDGKVITVKVASQVDTLYQLTTAHPSPSKPLPGLK